MTLISRRLRAEMTDAEAKLWAKLRGGRLDGLKFRRQHPIAGRWLTLPVRRFASSSNSTAEAQERDAERTAALEANGWRVVRFRNSQVLEDVEGIVEAIYREVHGLS